MVCFNVHLEVLVKAILAEEAENSCSIEIILVLCRLLGLRLNVEIACVADRTGIVNGHSHKTSHIVLLKSHIGVEKSLIALTAAPENVALTAELYGCFNSLLDLSCSVSENISRGRCACAVHISGMIEALSCAPEKLLACFSLLLLEVINYLVELFIGLSKAAVLGRKVSVVEAVVINGELVHDLESCVCLCDSTLFGICLAPGLIGSAAAEHICSVAAHGVPPGKSKLELLSHRLAVYYLIGIIVLECKGICAVLALVRDLTDCREKFAHFNYLHYVNTKFIIQIQGVSAPETLSIFYYSNRLLVKRFL